MNSHAQLHSVDCPQESKISVRLRHRPSALESMVKGSASWVSGHAQRSRPIRAQALSRGGASENSASMRAQIGSVGVVFGETGQSVYSRMSLGWTLESLPNDCELTSP